MNVNNETKSTLLHGAQSPMLSYDYKLNADEMREVETVMEEMGNDPDSIAYELVWRRHHN